jgi:hypothetical protein
MPDCKVDERQHLFVNFQTNTGDTAKVIFCNYPSAINRKQCRCSNEWFDDLGINATQDLYTTYPDPEPDPVTECTIMEKIQRMFPRVAIEGREAIVRGYHDEDKSRLSNIPFVCGQCERSVFGIVWYDLVRIMGISEGRLKAVQASIDVDNNRCLFPKVKVKGERNRVIVPIDLLPEIFDLFGDTQGAKSGANPDMSLSRISQIILKGVSSKFRELNIRGTGIARFAAFVEKMDFLVHVRTIAFNRISRDLEISKREIDTLRTRLTACNSTMTIMSEHTKILVRQVRALTARIASLEGRSHMNTEAIALLGGLAKPKMLTPLPGVDVETAARYHPGSANRNEPEPVGRKEWLKTLTMVAEMTGRSEPLSTEIDSTYLDMMTTMRMEMNAPTPSPAWRDTFLRICHLTGKANPTLSEIRTVYFSTRKRDREEEQHSSRKRHKGLNA